MNTDIVQHSCIIISDFTTDPLSDYLKNDGQLPSVRASSAPFNQVSQVLIDGEMDCWKETPDFAIVWTRPEATIRSFNRILNYQPCPMKQILQEVEQFADLIRRRAQRIESFFVPTWTLPYYHRGLGLLNMRREIGLSYVLMQMNLHLADALATSPNVYLLDASKWISTTGRRSSNPKLWLMGKMAFGPEVFQEASKDIKAGLRGIKGLAKKLVLVDLDETLWGGVVGDIGWQQLNLGGHDPIGEGFRDFQQALKALTNRGILLGIVSKNEEAVALEAIEQHPEMVLAIEDFAGWKINWKDKAENIVDLVSELNLGLDTVVFIDDNPAERSRIKDALPQVLVPEWTVDKMHFKRALLELACFDTAVMTDEDLARTEMYISERERNAVKESMPSLDEWLMSLDSIVKVETLNETNLARATQLLNKTNQMNLTTRRMSEVELFRYSRQRDQRVYVFRVSDRFGDQGLTGVASLKAEGSTGQIQDFVISCRVIGRGVEQTILHTLVEYGRSMGLDVIVAECLPTVRNKPCQDFFNNKSGFERRDKALTYAWDLENVYPVPSHIRLEISPSGN